MKTYEEEYFDQNSGVMKNKLGLDDAGKLRIYEYWSAAERERELQRNPIKGNFDLDHLKKIHEHLFSDVYEWAGKTREIDIAKDTSLTTQSNFAPYEDFGVLNFGLHKVLKDCNYLKDCSKPEAVTALTNTYSLLNYMHPFPEGNGRATRVFMSQLAQEAGFELDFGKVSPQLWNRAAADSMPQFDSKSGDKVRNADIKPIMQIFGCILKDNRSKEVIHENNDSEPSRGPER